MERKVVVNRVKIDRNKLLIFTLFFFLACSTLTLAFNTNIKFVASFIVVTFSFVVFAFFALKLTSSIIFRFWLFYWFLGYVASLFFLLNNSEEYFYGSWTSVGSYNFGLDGIIHAYSLFFLFLLVFVFFLIFFENLFRVKKKSLFYYSKSLSDEGRIRGQNRIGYIYFAIVIIIILQLFLTNYMFKNGIGIMIIKPPELPYKLVGILYYYRLLIYPLILLLLLSKIKNSISGFKLIFLVLILLIEIIQIGFFSLSKKTIFLHALPLLFILFYQSRYFLLGLSLILVLFLVSGVSIVRSLFFRQLITLKY